MKVAINGFGRIGRLSFRKLYKEEDIEIVAINDLTSPHMLAYLLRNDSVQKKFDAVVEEAEGGILVDGKFFPVYAEADASKLPWGELAFIQRSAVDHQRFSDDLFRRISIKCSSAAEKMRRRIHMGSRMCKHGDPRFLESIFFISIGRLKSRRFRPRVNRHGTFYHMG